MSTPPLSIPRATLFRLRVLYGLEHFREYFSSLSDSDLKSILLGFDFQTLLVPLLNHDELVERLVWFATHEQFEVKGVAA